MAQPTREQLIEAARKAAQESGTTAMSRSDFERLTRISQYHIYRLFPDGGWLELADLAGLDRHPHPNEPISDEMLLVDFHRVTLLLGNVPTWHSFAARANVSADVVRRRFGGLQGTLKRYRAWLVEHEPESPILSLPQARSEHEIASPPRVGLAASTAGLAQWTKTDGIEYGAPISFRGLRHAPINEQGVVYLFGMVSYELGFLVEAVHASYPDCEAKRCIDRLGNRWQRIRIEFEYRSSAFRDHAHNPTKCDFIVCWEHDWLDCPLEVLGLRHVIDSLEA